MSTRFATYLFAVKNSVCAVFLARSPWTVFNFDLHPPDRGNNRCVFDNRERFDLVSSVFSILRGSPVPLDIVKTETASSAIHYSFLGTVYGLVSDIDVDSEKYRYMGDMRFTMMAIRKITKRQCFTGKVWYLPPDDVDCRDPPEQGRCDYMDNDDLKSHQSGGEIDTSLSNVRIDGEPSTNGIEHACDKNHTKSHQPGGDTVTDVKVGDDLSGHGIESLCTRLPENGTVTSCPVNKYLPADGERISEVWKCVEGTFIGWAFVTLSHIGKGAYVVPGAELGDGVIYGMYFTDEMTRRNLLDVLGKVESGEYIDIRGVSMIKAKAYRFEPSPTAASKVMTIDGELVEFGPVQGEVFKGLGRVRCR